MKQYVYDLSGRLVVRYPGGSDSEIYDDAIELIEKRDAALAAAEERIKQLTRDRDILWGAVKRIASIEDCGCGVPCDCYSWYGIVRIAKDALGVEHEST